MTTTEKRLDNGELAGNHRTVEERLSGLGIEFQTIEHAAMRTVADSKALREGMTGGFSKNLFVRNKKGKMWLVTLCEDTQIDLRDLGDRIGAGRISFCSEDRLMRFLGVIPGAVTPLAVINDVDLQVTAVVEQRLLDEDPLHFHPCDNTMTTSLNRDGLLVYMADCRHEPLLLDLGQDNH